MCMLFGVHSVFAMRSLFIWCCSFLGILLLLSSAGRLLLKLFWVGVSLFCMYRRFRSGGIRGLIQLPCRCAQTLNGRSTSCSRLDQDKKKKWD